MKSGKDWRFRGGTTLLRRSKAGVIGESSVLGTEYSCVAQLAKVAVWYYRYCGLPFNFFCRLQKQNLFRLVLIDRILQFLIVTLSQPILAILYLNIIVSFFRLSVLDTHPAELHGEFFL